MTAPAASRTLVADFDSVQQRELFERVGFREGWLRLCAQLRTADLLSDELIVTDAQLLDGIFFLLLGPTGVAELLGRGPSEPMPIVVAARAPELHRARDLMTATADFTWSSAQSLTRLRAAGEVGVEVDLEAAREAWVQAAATRRVRVLPYASGEFPMAEALASAGPPPEGLSPEIVERLRETTRRSDANRILLETAAPPESVEAARWWWEQAYAAALARQHGATWLAFGPQSDRRVSGTTPPPAPPRRGRRERGPGTPGNSSSALLLDGSMVSTMATLPPAVYALVTHRAQACSAEWTRRHDARSLLGLALVVRETTTVSDTWDRHYWRAGARALALGAAALLSVLSVVVPGMAGWVVVPLLVALVAEVPWSDLKLLADTRPGQLRGVIHLPEGSP